MEYAIVKESQTNIRSAKRGSNERQGVHKWHPYYAGYSEQFVEDMLSYFNADRRSVVLDPWMGSGTTSLVSQRANIQSVGVEINPVMTHFAKAKTAQLLKQNITELGNSVVRSADDEQIKDVQQSYINVEEYLELDDFIQLTKLRNAVDRICNHTFHEMQVGDHLRSFFYSALFRVLRSVGKFEKGSNPTWLVKQIPALNLPKPSVHDLFLQFTKLMERDLSKAFGERAELPLPMILCGDSRSIPIDSESIDYIITSPPYLTRIDYAISTKPELLFLGFGENDEFDELRRTVMGAPVICDKDIVVDESWGKLCRDFLIEVENHQSKAAKSYYLPNFLQYFRDAFHSLQEIRRVLKAGGQACLVVQSSYFKEVEIKLGDIYVEMGLNLGLESQIIRRETVKQHLAHVNTKSSLYVRNKVYYEDCVLFSK